MLGKHRARLALALSLLTWLLDSNAAANDLLVLSRFNPPGLLRYSSTGAFLGQFANVTSGRSMTYGPDGNLYVGTNANISRYDGRTGAFLNVFVSAPNNALDPQPVDMTFGPDGNLYVAGDSSTVANRAVWRYNGQTGQSMGIFARQNDITTSPAGLTFGADGNLYVGDGFSVYRYSGTTGEFLSQFAHGAGLERAGEVRFGPDGNLYVKGNTILKYNGITGVSLANLFTVPSSPFTFGPDGNLYSGNSAVSRYTLSGTFIDQFIPVSSGGLSSAATLAFIPEPTAILLAMASLMLLPQRARTKTIQFSGTQSTRKETGTQLVSMQN